MINSSDAEALVDLVKRIRARARHRNGKKTDFYGPNPQGQVTYAPNGRVSLIIARSDLPQFASKNRKAGTPEENKAVVTGEPHRCAEPLHRIVA
jgi:Lipocalin-like domain